MKLIPSPKTIAGYGVALALTTGVALATDTTTATFDPTQLETTVTTQGQELDNHETRITTLENEHGGTTPVPGTIIQPVVAPVPAPVVDPTPTATPANMKTITSASFYKLNFVEMTGVCRYVYSDGSVSEETKEIQGTPGQLQIRSDWAQLYCQSVGTVVPL